MYELRDYQKEAVKAAVDFFRNTKKKTNGLLVLPTGSGKSLVAALWAERGAAVIDADQVAREVTKPGHPCLAKLVEAFSASILFTDGTLNRKALAKRAFADPAATQMLTAITHPPILKQCRELAAKAAADGAPFVVFDAPLLFESGLDADCDVTVAVLAAPEIRMNRIRARDALTEPEARLRMQTQPDDEFYRMRADHVLYNNGNLDELRAQAEAIVSCR